MAASFIGALRSPSKKPGRKPKPHTTAWGETIPGLAKCKDGRWRIIGSESAGKDVKFTEPDERRAVARFYAMSGKTGVDTETIRPSDEESRRIIEMTGVFPGMTATREHVRYLSRLFYGEPTDVQLEELELLLKAMEGVRVHSSILWAWVADQIRTKPKYVAQQTGIEQIGYLTNLKPPTVSPTLAEVGKLYHEKSGIDPHWRKKSENFWDQFMDVVGGAPTTLRDLTQELVADYKAAVFENPPSPTYVKHRFGQVKTIINYSSDWGKWSEDRTKALAFCTILSPPNATTLDPSPIDRADYHKLLDAAAGSTNRLSIMTPVLLLAMNACLYGSEVTDVQWSDLNLDAKTLVMDRGKTKVARVAVLWDRTVEALKTLPRIEGIANPFLTEATRQAHNANTITKYYRALRTAAGLSDEVRFAHIRDGSYTAACSTRGVDAATAQVLAGHRSGMKDHYVKRNPFMVEHACQAIEKTYFG